MVGIKKSPLFWKSLLILKKAFIKKIEDWLVGKKMDIQSLIF